MNITNKVRILIVSIFTVNMSTAHVIEGVSFLSPRSQSTNYARDIAGMTRYRTTEDNTTSQHYINITPYYSHSVKGKRMADALFGRDILTITGSEVENRQEEDLLADYFGLSPAFESSVKIKPHIQNALVIFNTHFTFDTYLAGLYFDMIAPVGLTQWHMELDELVIASGSDVPFPEKYMAQNAVQAPITHFKQALTGDVRFGQMQDPIAFGKIAPCPLSQKGASDIIMALGWHCIQNERGHFGINLRTAIPTGTRPTSEFFFEPLLGNGKHAELGVGFDGHLVLWEKDGTQEVSLYGGANITHLFNARQRRSFDLKDNRPLSRYMLLKEFDQDGNYINQLTPVINHTTLPCHVRMDIQADILFMLDYTGKNYSFNLGYSGFIRSKEKICLSGCGIPENRFGLKGIQNVTTDLGDPSTKTQSLATIFGNSLDQQSIVADPQSPVFIGTQNINVRSAASPRIILNKLFTHFGYTSLKHTHCQPFFGIGGEVEFEGINPRNRTQSVHDTLAIWGIWLKGGIAL
ncbi:MAG: hypothetical protein NT124_00225 [Candidatus Dependentiae bacterium]|nr:hypothetical protein [Candidatus Dependentiae bacterium]